MTKPKTCDPLSRAAASGDKTEGRRFDPYRACHYPHIHFFVATMTRLSEVFGS